ncbi:SGNH/GDSL hydrolase family protein [Hyunsoonleella pacifica]|uniref:G-D-S-L family lipolytic protein n=1 Tax=Hyunsoonleella pacifica TaxID=1080224 RepID=A0A4Q9FQ97_9FLAO|nr:G-D-S-L family lipolytic protein [Hyunsoonleella pacifica]TBN16401.1 G-D-S-L family lipolytic protein [Hyunsoonleella pacifica]GGD19732.1 outer membrane protein [Hyunsoonleella pacifica]
MKNIKYIILSIFALSFLACENEELEELRNKNSTEEIILPELTSGSADFSNYVAVGASFTAGFTDGALFIAGQENSFPNILSQQFMKVGGNELTQPLMNDNIGGLLIGGMPNPQFLPRLFFNGTGPQRLPSTPTTEGAANLGGTFTNMGVPGAKSFHLLFDGYGNPANLSLELANPYYVRMASSPTATVLGDALAQNPTFFTLSEIGGNDVLGFATSGGDGSNPITDTATFDASFNALVGALTSNGAKGVVTNVPYVTDLPFFTTVPNNALELDAATAAQLTGVFQAVSGIFLQGAVLQGVPIEQAQALAAQYAITFNEGPNRWIIDVPVTQTNPLGFRQMTEDELLVLTIDQTALAQGYGTVALTPEVLQVLGLLQQGGTPTPEQAGLVLAAVNGIDDKDALDSDELSEIITATDAFNATIESVANSNESIALVNLNTILSQVASTGISFDEFTLTAGLVTGGAIGLDGIHLNARGYALMANKFLEAIDEAFGSNFVASGSLAKASNYPVNYPFSLP